MVGHSIDCVGCCSLSRHHWCYRYSLSLSLSLSLFIVHCLLIVSPVFALFRGSIFLYSLSFFTLSECFFLFHCLYVYHFLVVCFACLVCLSLSFFLSLSLSFSLTLSLSLSLSLFAIIKSSSSFIEN